MPTQDQLRVPGAKNKLHSSPMKATMSNPKISDKQKTAKLQMENTQEFKKAKRDLTKVSF